MPTENVGRGFVILLTLTVQWAVCQPHQVKVFSHGIVSGMTRDNRGLYPVEG
jgi:hypothetical protein